MILPIIGGVVALGAGSVTCLRGVTTESGSGAGGEWRLRFACWRWIAESRRRDKNGVFSDWTRMGVYKLTEKAKAKAAAMSTVLLPPAALAAMTGLVKIKRASFSDQ